LWVAVGVAVGIIVLGGFVNFVVSDVVVGCVCFIVGGSGAFNEPACVLCGFMCSFVVFVVFVVVVGGLSPALLKKSLVFRLFLWS
jgi:hypothetical protein